MAKKQNKPIKTCADCIHESACRVWTGGRYISDISASQCPNHQTVKESGAYLCGVLDERKRKKTNADRIRSMSDEELAKFIDDIAQSVADGEYCTAFLNVKNFPYSCEDTKKACVAHVIDWLQQPAAESDNETVGERKDGDRNG